MKNYIKAVSGVTLALGMAGLMVVPVSASTFDDATDTLTLEETVANGVGYEWGLSEADGNKFVASLTAGKKITIDKATKANLLKNLTATQKFFDDAKAEGPTGVAKFEAFKTAMQKMKELVIQGTEDFVLDDELVEKMKTVLVDNEMINPTKGIEHLSLVFAGKNVDMTGLSDEKFDALFSKVKLKLINAVKIKATPHHAGKLVKMDKENIDAGNSPILNPDNIEFTKADKTGLKKKKEEGEKKAEEEKDNKKVKKEVDDLRAILVKAGELFNDIYADDEDVAEMIGKIDGAIKAIEEKKKALGAPDAGYRSEANEAGKVDMLVAGMAVTTLAGAAVVLGRKNK